MTRIFAITLIFIIPILMHAHQAEISTTMLIEKEGKWLVQINAALTAFEYEVKQEYGEAAYNSPEEFETLVAKVAQERLSIFYDDQAVSFTMPQVKLGHETSLVMFMNEVPEHYQSIRVDNNVFSKIHNSRSALVVLKEGYDVERFELNDSNEHSAELKVIGSGLELVENPISKASMSIYALLTLAVIIIGYFILRAAGKLNQGRGNDPLAID